MFMCGSLWGGGMNDIIYDAEGAREGRYGFTRGPLWVHMRADMGEQAVMGLQSRAVSAQVTKHFVSIF